MQLDLYPLSPIQQGMLFHWLLDPHSGTDIEQIVGDLDETVDPDRFRRAWQRVVDGISVLRTQFAWEGRKTPAQGIADVAIVPFRFEDLAAIDPVQAEETIATFLAQDRIDGVDLACAPAMRITLFRLAPEKHRMVWTFHHILIDGRSFETILTEVFEGYRSGLDAPLAADIDRPYRAYAEWTERQDPEASRKFWQERLRGFAAPTPLPATGAVQAQSIQFGESETRLSARTAHALRELAARYELSLNTVIMGAWALLLARHSGESEVVFGATKTTRRGTIPDADATPGMFLATIPVRARIDEDLTIREWLQRIRAEWVSLRGNEHLPLVDILRVSDIHPGSPLFETLVVFENYQFGARLNRRGGDWSRRQFQIREQTGLPLTLLVYDEDELVIKMDYDARRFERASVDRLIDQVAQVLEDWTCDEDRPVWATSLLAPREQQLVVHEWNATQRPVLTSASLAELVVAQVARTPDRPAVLFASDALTYSELNRRANRLAHALIGVGVGPDIIVGVCVERSVDLMVALLAVAKSGGAWVPIDPALPVDRIAHMQQDSGMRALVTQRHLAERIDRADVTMITVDLADLETLPTANPHVVVTPENLAYVLYTSGSTGLPKGVEISRGALQNLLASMKEWLALAADDRILNVTTISFDIAEADVWLPWLVGATTIIASRDEAADGARLAALLAEHDITFMQATPVSWRALLAAGWQGSTSLQAVCTGEAMPPEIVAPLLARTRRLWNLYGPTETTIWSTGYEVTRADAPVLIGRPIANTTTYVLDAHRQLVPIGVTGELYIGGAGVARGYRNRPELTAEKFLGDPFRPGERVYRTGDLARWHADGNLECLGRTDHQVKIRGFRIELGEIEAALLAQPGIAQTVVIAREDVPGDRRLVAYVVTNDGTAKPDTGAMRAALKTTLPDYMLPSAIVQLDTMPLTANGKIDRKALPAPDASAHSARPTSRPPRTYTEGLLRDIWSDLFSGRDVAVTDDFFELGGHSLLAVQLMNRVKEVFGKQLPLNAVFESPTVESLARHIEDDRKRLGLHSLVSVRAAGSRPPIFWIPGGAALGLFTLRGVLTRLSPDQPVYGLGSMAPKSIDDVESVEQRAANYLELIRRQQPHGPYLLAGFCAGGRVAYEIAQRLTDMGELVAFVGLINCTVPRFPTTRSQKLRFKMQRLRHQLAEARRSGTTPTGYVRAKLRDRAAARVEQARLNASKREVQERGLDGGVVAHNQLLLDATVAKFEQYEPRPYPGPVSLFISVDDEDVAGVADSLDPRLQWRRLVERVDVRRFPGGHLAIVEMPRAEVFATAMQAALDAALELAQTPSQTSTS